MFAEDQSLFESTDFDEQHESLISSGGVFASTLKSFESDSKCVDMLPMEQRQRVMNAMSEYQDLLLPPKVCPGCASFRKKKRTGTEYEKKLLAVHAKVIESTYILRIGLRTYESEKINESSKEYAAYATRMNQLANTLEGLVVKNNSHAKDEIKESLEGVESFVKDFFPTEMPDNLGEANKRLKKTRELLGAAEVTKRNLVSAQANLQEILNSAASVSAAKSKDKMDAIDRETVLLKEACDQVTGGFRGIEGRMLPLGMGDVLENHRQYAEQLEKTMDSRLKALKKTWKTIRGQSTYRPVAVYEVELEDFKPDKIGTTVAAGVTGAATGAGKAVEKAGMKAAHTFAQAVTVPTKVVTSAGNIAVKGVSAGVSAAVSLPNSAMKEMSEGVKGVAGNISTGVRGVSDNISSGVKDISGGLSTGVKVITQMK